MALEFITFIIMVLMVASTAFHDEQYSLDGPINTFTFSEPQSFLEIRPYCFSNSTGSCWRLRDERELAFRFRTQLAHGLLVHHAVLNQPNKLGYDLYIKLVKGKLVISHIFNNEVTSFSLGRGLTNDKWHDVRLVVNPVSGNLTIVLDGNPQTMTSATLQARPLYDFHGDEIETVLFFGGLNPKDTILAQQYGYEQFIGCLQDIELMVNGTKLQNLESFSHAKVHKGCIDRCYNDDWCLHNSMCVNHYSGMSCDCFGTKHEGSVCGSDNLTTITIRGYSYVSFKIYDWVDKVYFDHTRISVTFRTSFDDSVLFYGFGEIPTRNYIAASLKDGSVHFAIDFGKGPLEIMLGNNLNDGWWHNLTILHTREKVEVSLDGLSKINDLVEISEDPYLHLDPRFFVGGVPIKVPKYGLKSINNFVGTMREAYFGTVSILQRLRTEERTAEYHGLFPPEYGYYEVNVLPVTFFYPESKIRLTAEHTNSISLHMDFKTNLSICVLAHSGVENDNFTGYWQLGLENGAAIISVVVGRSKNYSIYPVKLGQNLSDGKWHNVKMEIVNGKVHLAVNYLLTGSEVINESVAFSTKIYVGGSMKNPETGFVGCMRQIRLNGQYMDPRRVVDSDQIKGGEISLDNCQLVDPCARPGVCEHDGKCIMKDKKVLCICAPGYVGQTCHFSKHRRTCEELFLVGYRKEGVYPIDVDGNGPHPPAYVYCDMATELTTTTIVTNLPSEFVVRKAGMKSFRLEVTYRNFTSEMLQTLIRHSKNCTQTIRYDCFKAPLGLRTFTWFRTSDKGSYLSSFGKWKDSHCTCGEARNCSNPEKRCNCDAVDQRWRNDEVELHNPKHLGITEMFFLQPDDLTNDAEGRITLGPLKCLEMDTQQYVITFKTSESYLEIPGWKTGDLAFSFRTSHKRAILFYQPALYSTHSHFKIFLVNENELSFEFSVRGKPKSVNITHKNPLNSGEWQQVWVDYDRHHVRFTINAESRMYDLEKNEEFGLFEETLYVGGAPQEYLGESRIKDGFVGCLRGLVVNEEVTNLFAYLSPRTPQIITGCKPSCDPNPCKNGATCNEYWGTYTCECSNKWAHSGRHCEKNLNENGVTFVTENGHFHQLYVEDQRMPAILTEDILANIRTHNSKGLILYAHDQYNNFVQLHIKDGNQLAFTYNSFRQLVQGSVTYDELTRGKPVQIFVDREPERTVLHVNEQRTVIPYPMKLADKYRQNPWVSGVELETVRPPRPPVEPKPYLQMFIGALENSLNMESKLRGFIGCLTGLTIGNTTFNLMRLVDENPGTENFRKGCNVSCDTDPCQNDGYCIEDWRNMQHDCDCTMTSYFGKKCDDDIGGRFEGSSIVKYMFVPDASTYQKVEVHIAFSTSATFESPAVILFVNSKVDERNYVLVALTPQGELLLQEDDGGRRVVRSLLKNNDSSSGTFMDGRRHWISYNRSIENIRYMVDGKVVTTSVSKTEPGHETENTKYGGEISDTVMVGGMEFIDNRFANYNYYKGCLSNVFIKIDSFNVYPLETAFGIRHGSQQLHVTNPVKESSCATFDKELNRMNINLPNILNFSVPPEWKPSEPAKITYVSWDDGDHYLEMRTAELTTNRVGLILGIFLLILIISLGIYLWRVDWKDKQYRYEEGTGADVIFPSKKQRLSDNGLKGGKNGVGLLYRDLSDESLTKFYPYANYIDDRTYSENSPFLDGEEPTSDADTKRIDDSEEDLEPVSDPEIPLKKTSSQDLDWEPSVDSIDLVSDDVGEATDDDAYEPDSDSPELPPRVRAALSTVSEASVETERDLREASPEVSEVRLPENENSKQPEQDTKDVSSSIEKNEPGVKPQQKAFVGPRPSPVFLANNQRSFANPISYLGGPKLQHPKYTKQNSVESIISLD